MRRRRGWAWLLAFVALAGGFLGPRRGEAQLRSITGTLRSGVSFDDQRVGETTTQRSDLRHDYSLGAQGLILDPRLATFEATATLGGITPLLGDVSAAQNTSGALNLNILPISRIPLSLRHFQAYGWNGTTTEVMSSGLAWRVSHPLYPTLSLNVDRTAVRASGLSPSETTFLNGTLRSAYKRENLDLTGELGARHSEDSVQRTSTTSSFGTLNGTYLASPATSLQGGANYLQERDSLSAGISATLTNRPDPTLTRGVNAGLRASRGGGTTTYALDAGGNLSKSYRLGPPLQAFLTAGASFAADVVADQPAPRPGAPSGGTPEGFLSLTASGGGGVTYSGLRYLTTTADATVTALYEDESQRGVGARGSFHLGLTGQNLGPVSAGADYTFRAERGVVNASDHTLSIRGNVAARLGPTLAVEAFAQSGMFLPGGSQTGATTGENLTLSGGGRALYTGIPFVTWTLNSQYRFSRSGGFGTQALTTGTMLTYTPYGRLRGTLAVDREDTLTTGETRHSLRVDISYRLGATSFNLTYSADVLSGRGQSPVFQRAMLTWTRPFGRRFR